MWKVEKVRGTKQYLHYNRTLTRELCVACSIISINGNHDTHSKPQPQIVWADGCFKSMLLTHRQSDRFSRSQWNSLTVYNRRLIWVICGQSLICLTNNSWFKHLSEVFLSFIMTIANKEVKQTQNHNDYTRKGEEAHLQTKLTGKTDELCFGCINIHREEERMIQSIIFATTATTTTRLLLSLLSSPSSALSQTPQTVADDMIASLMT